MAEAGTPFEYNFRARDIRESMAGGKEEFELDELTENYLEERDRQLEDYLANFSGGSTELVFAPILDAVTVDASRQVPLSREASGVRVIARVGTQFTTAAVITVYKNGSSIGTVDFPTATTLVDETITEAFAEQDTLKVGVTTAGVAGAGLVITCAMV